MKKIILGQDKIAYTRMGALGKPKLLMLHGFMANSCYYLEGMQYLKDRFDILVPDFPGFGLSDPYKNKSHSLSNYRDSIFSLCEFLDFKPFHLYGWSLGGMIGILMVNKRPQIVRKMIIQSTPLSKADIDIPGVEKVLSFLLKSEQLLKVANGAKAKIGKQIFTQLLRQFNRHYLQIDQRNGHIYYSFRTMNLETMADIWQDMKDNDLTGKVKKIGKKTLVLVGDHDVQVFPESVKKLSKMIEDSKFRMIENGTHAMFWDFPGKIARISQNFLMD